MTIPMLGKQYSFWGGPIIRSGRYVWDHTTGNPVLRDQYGNIWEIPIEDPFLTYGDAVDNAPRLKNKKPN